MRRAESIRQAIATLTAESAAPGVSPESKATARVWIDALRWAVGDSPTDLGQFLAEVEMIRDEG